MAKESLFNIINNHLFFEDLSVLDLFTGTGNISYEFASRGAASVISVDSNFKCVNFVKQSAQDLNFECIRVVRADVFRFLSYATQQFDLVFADPPYDLENIREIAQIVMDKKLLTPGGFLIIEHPRTVDLSDHPWFFEHRKYGKVNFSFFIAPEE